MPPHPAFQLVDYQRVPSLGLAVEQFRHRCTGARHLHVGAADDNNTCLIAFLTLPQDSTGVAHILEHITLCGSERFPVRDLFFVMLRCSLNNSMNAFTTQDRTVYHFSTRYRKDFDNLLQVYLDALFFPRLDPLDFAQEGCHVEFADPENPESELVYNGVVYNEMKGVMSSPVAQARQHLLSHLFPTLSYRYNSGGDPDWIPSLRYEQLKDFHARHYHPSNAVFMTYGNFPAVEHQARFEGCALSRFERRTFSLAIPDEQRHSAPISVAARYPFVDTGDATNQTHIVLGWLLSRCTAPREIIKARLLASVLLDNSASPLRQALETTDLGTAPSALCGLDDSAREAIFVCGLQGSNPDKAAAVERLVLDVLTDVASSGIPQAQVESMLHRLELNHHEVTAGRFPYGLQLLVTALGPLLHGGDPVAVLDIDPVVSRLYDMIEDPGFIKDLVRRLLLDNPHRVQLTMEPDTKLSARRAAETKRLAMLKAGMNTAQRLRVGEISKRLRMRQETENDLEILPRVGLKDIPFELKTPAGVCSRIDGMQATWFAQATNGIVYEQIVADLPKLDLERLNELPLFCTCISEVGCGHRNYLEAQARQAVSTGGISARISVRAGVSDVQRTRGVFVLEGKALARNHGALAELLRETLMNARFDELPHLRELIAQRRARAEALVTERGHVLAMAAATAGMGPCAALVHGWDGLQGLTRLQTLDHALDDEAEVSAFSDRLAHTRDAICHAPRQILVVSEQTEEPGIGTALEDQWARRTLDIEQPPFAPDPVNFVVRQGWSISTEVNYCAKAYPTVAYDHPDAATLTVLGPFLRNGYLHRAIREQGGAYGAGASYDPDTGAFRLFSYRDPRLTETLSDFDRALDWLQSARHHPRQVDEAILGAIRDLDRPDSPAGETIAGFYDTVHGRTPEKRRRFRQAVLRVGFDDLRDVVDRCLSPEVASIAVVSNRKTLEQHPELGLQLRNFVGKA